MTRATDLVRLRKLLQERRRSLLNVNSGTQAELDALQGQERDPEFEENAQSELADYTLHHLLEGQRRELMLIDAALRRMDNGVFGQCVDCEQDIPLDRLEALPFAIRCAEDATRHEREMQGGAMATPSM